MEQMKNPVHLAHWFMQQHVQPGDQVLDATAGNGYDTLFLARLVGATGQVYAFDSQDLAIQRTRERLQEAKVETWVNLFHCGHEHLETYVPGKVQGIMFNLGYLPQAQHQFATQAETTLLALQQASNLLEIKGLITLVVYVGHAGANDEKNAVENWVQNLPQQRWHVLKCTYPNRVHNPPFLLVLQKLA